MKLWYVVRTKPSMEDRAVWHLQNQGFEVYLPRYRKQVRHARRVTTVMRPLFPSYLFVNLDLISQHWHCINSTVGVASLIPYAHAPKPISRTIVDAIREREDDGGAVSLAPHGLQRGDRVHIREGALADHLGLLEEVCDEKRVILLLDIMGREVRVTTDIENLSKVS